MCFNMEGNTKSLYERMEYDREYEDTAGIVDASGKRLRMLRIDGRLHTPLGEKYVKDAFKTDIRPDDVFICGYVKTGAHWAVHYLRGIIRDEIHYDPLAKASTMMELAPREVKDSLPSPRILNTHIHFDQIPQKIKEYKNKIILTRRNPKDTLVSLFNHARKLPMFYDYYGEFNDFFELFVEGNVDNGNFFDYYKKWEEALRQHPDQPVLWVDYEDLKEDMPAGLKRVCQFLGVELPDSKIQEIARVVEFKNMRQAYGDEFFVRKGEVGLWKNWLTVAQSERIDAELKRRMAGSDYNPRYTI